MKAAGEAPRRLDLMGKDGSGATFRWEKRTLLAILRNWTVLDMRCTNRAWLKYRDVQWKLAGYAMRGGTGEPMVRLACLAELTNARTKPLRSLMWDR